MLKEYIHDESRVLNRIQEAFFFWFVLFLDCNIQRSVINVVRFRDLMRNELFILVQ